MTVSSCFSSNSLLVPMESRPMMEVGSPWVPVHMMTSLLIRDALDLIRPDKHLVRDVQVTHLPGNFCIVNHAGSCKGNLSSVTGSGIGCLLHA